MKIQPLLVSLIVFTTFSSYTKTVYFSPGQWGQIFNINDPIANADGHFMSMHAVKCMLEQHGYTVKQADSLKNLTDVHCIITFDIPTDQLEDLSAYPREKCFTILWEPPSVIPSNYQSLYHQFFSQVYTWHDGLVNDDIYKKFYYPVLNQMIENVVPFEQRKLCTLIAGNKNSSHPDELYSARRQAIEYFERHHCQDFDLYGRWWPAYKNYLGTILKKIDVLKNYKFCICYENIKDIPGYITEKIFDCFRSGCVPVYWGAENVTDYIPENCFIDRRKFNSDEQLYQFMNNMDATTHQTYIENIQKFLQSPAAHLFSIDTFCTIMFLLVSTIKE